MFVPPLLLAFSLSHACDPAFQKGRSIGPRMNEHNNGHISSPPGPSSNNEDPDVNIHSGGGRGITQLEAHITGATLYER